MGREVCLVGVKRRREIGGPEIGEKIQTKIGATILDEIASHIQSYFIYVLILFFFVFSFSYLIKLSFPFVCVCVFFL